MKALLPLLACFLALTACSSRPPADPASVLGDRDRSIAARTRAVEALAAEMDAAADPGPFREELKSIVWSRREPLALRRAAAEALLKRDADDTEMMLALLLPTEPSAGMTAFIAELAVERGWTSHTAPMIRAWARPRPDAPNSERPEPEAIAALHPDEPPFETVFRVFVTPAEDRAFGEKERRAAWEALGKIDPTGERTAARLAGLPPSDDPLIAGVRDAAVSIGSVPTTQEQLEWLTLLREDAGAWERATRIVSTLTGAQRDGFSLRHVAAVLDAEAQTPERLTLSRDRLLSELRSRLASRTRTTRSAEGGARDPLAESLSRAEPDLSWGDALHALAIDDALAEPGLVAQLFEHADRDHADTSTEYGGILLRERGKGPTALLYPPRPAQRLSDKRFIAAPEMFTQHPTALAHFHYHVQSTANARYAGPGPGDKAYADTFGRANIVLTFLDENTLAIDYYQPSGPTIDLGQITRP